MNFIQSFTPNCNSHFINYPIRPSAILKLDTLVDLKRSWLFAEWDERCPFSWKVREFFPYREPLDPSTTNLNIDQINNCFWEVRGMWKLWLHEKEQGCWEKVVVNQLDYDWFIENVAVPYYDENSHFDVEKFEGLVFWKSAPYRMYTLIEGNHRVSAWINSKDHKALPATIYVGHPKN